MPTNHDLDVNAGLSEPSRSPTGGRTSHGVDCKDHPDDQLRQAESLDLTQLCSTLPKYCRLQNEREAWLREAHRQEAEKHCEARSKCDKLEKALAYKERIVNSCGKRIRVLSAGSRRLIRRNKQLLRRNKKLSRREPLLRQPFHRNKSQMTNQELDESSARENYEKIITQLVTDFNKQQQEANTASIRMIQELVQSQQAAYTESIRMIQELAQNQQEANTASIRMIQELVQNQQAAYTESTKWMQESFKTTLKDSVQMIHATSLGQKSIVPSHWPIITNNASLPATSGPNFSAPASFPATSEQQMPVPASSSNMVYFEPIDNTSMSSSGAHRINRPSTPTWSPRSQVSREYPMQLPSRSEYQDLPWPSSPRY